MRSSREQSWVGNRDRHHNSGMPVWLVLLAEVVCKEVVR